MRKDQLADNKETIVAGIYHSDYGFSTIDVPARPALKKGDVDFDADPFFTNQLNELRPSRKESKARRRFKTFAKLVLLALILAESYLAITYFFPFLAYNSAFTVTVLGYTLGTIALMGLALAAIAVGCLLINAFVSWLTKGPLTDVDDLGAAMSLNDINLSRPTPTIMSASQGHEFELFYNFLKSENVSPEMLAEIKESAEWARQLSQALACLPPISITNLIKGRGFRLNYSPKQDKIMSKLAASISKRIAELKENQSCLIPCGLAGEQMMRSALLRVTRTQNDNYNITLVTRDSTLNTCATVQVAAKSKVLAKIIFADVPGEKFANPEWVQALLMQQVPNEETSEVSFRRLFNDILEHQQEVEAEHFRKQAPAGRTLQNLMTFINDETASDDPALQERRKLRLQLSSLFLCHRKFKGKLEKSFIKREGMKRSIDNIRRRSLMMRDRGYLSVDECAKLDIELDFVEAQVNNAELAVANPKIPLPSRITTNNNSKINLECTVESTSRSELETEKVDMKIGVSDAIEVRPPRNLDDKQRFAKPRDQVVTVQGNLVETCAQLETFHNNCEQLIERQEFLQCQIDIMKLADALPFDVYEKLPDSERKEEDYEEYEYWVKNYVGDDEFGDPIYEDEKKIGRYYVGPEYKLKASNVWTMTDGLEGETLAELQFKVAQLITNLCVKLTHAAKNTKTLLPDRLVALAKMGFILDHLTHMNAAENDYYHVYRLPGHDFVINTILFKGTADKRGLYLRDDGTNETLLKNQLNNVYRWGSDQQRQELRFIGIRYHLHSGNYLHKSNLGGMAFGRLSLIRDTQWKKNIKALVDSFDVFAPGAANADPEDKRFFARFAQWGKPVKSKSISSAGMRNSLSGRGHHGNTQEAHVDKPEKRFRALLKQAFPDNHKLDLPQDFTKSDLSDLLNMLDNKFVLTNLIDMLHNKTHILMNPDVRRAIELILFNIRAMSDRDYYSDKAVQIPADLPAEFKRAFTLAGRQGQIDLALFIASISLRLKNFYGKLHPDRHRKAGIIDALPDFHQEISGWLTESLLEEGDKKPFRYQLLNHFLFYMNQLSELNKQQLHDMIYLNAVSALTVISRTEHDPSLNDQFQRFYLQWGSKINEIFQRDPELLRFTMERICQYVNKPLPAEPWGGQFPTYSSGSYKIDVSRGAFYENGARFGQLPGVIVANSGFGALFPDLQISMSDIKVANEDGLEVYEFEYPQGTVNRIELKDGLEVSIFRQMPGMQWLCYAGEEPFIQDEQKQGQGIPDAFTLTKKNIACPNFLMSDNLFVDPDVDLCFYSFTDAGEAQFKLQFKRAWLSRKVSLDTIEDMREDSAERHQGMNALLGDMTAYPFLNCFSRFENAEQILLWRSGSTLKEVELVRYGLHFRVSGQRLDCLNHEFKDYHVPIPVPERDTKYLPSALILKSNTVRKDDLLLVPHFGSDKFEVALPDITFSTIVKSAYDYAIVGKMPELPESERQIWKFDEASSRHQYHVFSMAGDAKTLTGHGKNQLSAVIDLLSYLVIARERIFNNSYIHLQEYLDQINRMGEQYFQISTMEERYEFVSSCHKMMIAAQEASTPKAIGASDPNAIAIALHGLLAIKPRLNQTLQGNIEEYIRGLYTVLQGFGKTVNTKLRLTEEQEAECKKLMSAEQVASLIKDTDSEKQLSVVREKIEPVQDKRQFRGGCDSGSLYRRLRDILLYGESKQAFTFLHIEPHNIIEIFEDMYNILQSSAVDSEKFRQLHMSLVSLSADHDGWIALLRALVVVRIHQPQLELPVFPTIDLRPKPSRYSYSWGRFQLDRETRDAIDAADEERDRVARRQVSDFVNQITRIAEAHVNYQRNSGAGRKPKTFVLPRNMGVPGSSVEPEKLVQPDEKKAPVVIGHHINVDRLVSEQPVYPALFDKGELQAYFGRTQKVPDKYLKAGLDLRASYHHAEPCVQKMAEEIQTEIEIAKEVLCNRKLRSIDKKKFGRLKALLKSKRSAADKIREGIEAKIKQQLDLSGGNLIYMESKVGYATPLTWSGLLILYYQRDFQAIRENLLPGMDYDFIIAELDKYFVATLKVQWTDYLIYTCQELQKDDLLSDIFMGEKLFEMLTRPILTADPELIIIQAISGFIFNRGQLEMVDKLLKDETLLLQAPTGTGKTSVIMILLGRYKATGENLVTLKFLDPLLPEGVKRLQGVLGDYLRQTVKPVLYDSSMPSIVLQTIDRQRVRVSRFRQMYETMQEIKANKGCMVTNHKTGSLLVTKMLALLDSYAQLPEDAQLPELAFEHVYYLAKIFDDRIKHEHVLIDEHDSFLNPTKEDHLRVDQPVNTPAFIWQTALEIFEGLRTHPTLGLSKNIQSELPDQEREQIRQEVAVDYARKLSDQLYQLHELAIDEEQLADYFKGENEDVLRTVDKHFEKAKDDQLLNVCDALVVAKDLFTVFLKHTLGKKNTKHYIRHAGGEHTVPCERPGVAADSSEYDDIRERVCYMIADHYQQGVSFSYFKMWFLKIIRDANTERTERELLSCDETPSGMKFKSFFPDESLQILSDKDVSRLHAKANNDPIIIRRFLNVLLPKLGISSARASSDAQNQVSQSFKVCGVSATQGAVKGFHRKFNKEGACKDGVTGEMLLRMLGQLETTDVLHYDPSNPRAIVPNLVQRYGAQVIIDGGGAMSELDPSETAQQICAVQPGKLKAVGYFDLQGDKQVWVPAQNGNGKKKHEQVSMQQTGFYYHASQARGADAVIAPLPAILLEDGKDTVEDINQHRGRLRKEKHPLRLAVPNNSGITSADDLLNRGIAKEALKKADYLYRSKRQEVRDILRVAMIKKLVNTIISSESSEGTDKEKLAIALRTMKQFSKDNILVTRKTQLYQVPGEYYRANKHILREDKDSVEELNLLRDQYCEIAEEHGLYEAAEELRALDFAGLKAYLPTRVYPGSVMTDQAVEIQLNVDVAVEQDITLTVDTDVDREDEDMPYYLDHQCKDGYYFNAYKEHPYTRINQHYDRIIHFTENHLPMDRQKYAGSSLFFRKPHDNKQNRLAFVQLSNDKFIAMDFLDKGKNLKGYIYDTRTRRLVHQGDRYDCREIDALLACLESGARDCPEQLRPSVRAFAQMRFEDGQMNLCPREGTSMGYSPLEFECLKEWLLEVNDDMDMERYFVGEVMKNRQDELEGYSTSALAQLFQEVKKELADRKMFAN